MNVTEALKILGLTAPVKEHVAKSSYRKLALKHHPDVGGDVGQFRLIEKAYRTVIKNTDILESDTGILETVDGVPITDLGKGYPLNVSAKTCEDCEGQGYRTYQEPMEVDCTKCKGTGLKKEKCRRCSGTGEYKRGNCVVGECFACKGSGEYIPAMQAVKQGRINVFDLYSFWKDTIPRKYLCTHCGGRGTKMEQKGKTSAAICGNCEGKGEIRLWNPVIPRGYLMSAKV